ncbi:MAG: FAD-binding protein, partial [Planctomycetota bacterium]
MLNTKQLNIHFPFKSNHLTRAYTKSAKKLFCFQCGMTIKGINRVLDARKLSLKTSGASNGQTIAGAVSTGTHGSAFDVGAVQDSVVGIHLLTGPSSHVWLERASYPVVRSGFANMLGARLVRDDDLFNAA